MAQKRRAATYIPSDNLKIYLREIGQIPPLKHEEEMLLGERAQAGDEDAVRRLVEANLRFVVAVAKRYRHLNMNLMDLINAGNIGLLEAARRYKPEKNLRFITYAVWWIRQAMLSSLSSQSRAFSVPQRIANLLYRIGKSSRELTHNLEREPSSAELASSMSMTDQELESLLALDSKQISLDQGIRDEEGGESQIEIPHVDPAEASLMRQSVIEQIDRVLQDLEPQSRRVLSLRFGLDGSEPRSLKEVGDVLKISRERVRQIESKAMQKLRQNRKLRSLNVHLN